MEKLLVIINPWAGRGAAGRRRPELEAALRSVGVEHEIVATHAHGGAIELAWQGVERGYKRIVAVGGDGTLNEVVNGIKGAEASLSRRAQLGIIPLGTGSDFIKTLEGVDANDIGGGIRRVTGEQVRTIDLGRVQVGDDEPRYFINALGMGFDAQAAAESLKLTKLKGLAVYLVAILRALVNYKAHPMNVEYDDKHLHRRLLFASVANGRCQGGGFWLTPDASIDDGLLDLCLVDKMRLDEIIRHIPKVMEGTHTRLKQVTMGRARSISVTSAASIPVATDGEVISTDARSVRVEVLPGALEVLA
ncbi:MAG: diacylglycerol kinase family lipid kinase [Kouleothrix sp.]|nr:diacylglycerol kinase family lipid kinase [Kouleothrix sp.]